MIEKTRIIGFGLIVTMLAIGVQWLGCENTGESSKLAGESDDSSADADGDGDDEQDVDWGDDEWDPEPEEDSSADTDMDDNSDSDDDKNTDTDEDSDTDKDTDSETDEDCDTENEVVLYLSADDSNSMAGPVVARAIIRAGGRVSKALRTYEFLNYYNFDYKAAEAGHVSVTAQMQEEEDTYNLQIGVRAPDQNASERRQLNLTLSIDTSGSMSGSPIELVKESCRVLAGSLRGGDVISMVTWNNEQAVVLESHVVDGSNDKTLLNKCSSLNAGGSTNLHSGLVKAYELARNNFSSDRINRVILMSDGGANTGLTNANLIAEEADDAEGEAIYMMGVGLGEGSYYNDDLMDTVTDKGKGAYIFIDSKEEAMKMFNRRFISNVEVAARDVQVELTMPPSFRMVEFHGEEFSGDPEEVEPQHLAPNDAMIFHQIVESCDPSVVQPDFRIRVKASFLDPFTRNPMSDEFEATFEELLEGENALLRKGNAIVAYAETLKEIRMSAGEGAHGLIDSALDKVDAAINSLPEDEDLIEIRDLLKTYRERF
ncbi:MAG: VWA domain-containing protein [Proteobacteria bacterium]|nr:VWA domain-containing protein [Pseudomonadota bacterium]